MLWLISHTTRPQKQNPTLIYHKTRALIFVREPTNSGPIRKLVGAPLAHPSVCLQGAWGAPPAEITLIHSHGRPSNFLWNPMMFAGMTRRIWQGMLKKHMEFQRKIIEVFNICPSVMDVAHPPLAHALSRCTS